MTKQFFYIDPLAAAWMAKHFGMKFGVKHNGVVHWNCIGKINEPFEPLQRPEDILDPISDPTPLMRSPLGAAVPAGYSWGVFGDQIGIIAAWRFFLIARRRRKRSQFVSHFCQKYTRCFKQGNEDALKTLELQENNAVNGFSMTAAFEGRKMSLPCLQPFRLALPLPAGLRPATPALSTGLVPVHWKRYLFLRRTL